MLHTLRKRKRPAALALLLAFAFAWVLPSQACFAHTAAGGAAPMVCPDCAGCDPANCGASLSAQCAASLLPSLATSSHAPHKAAPMPALAVAFPALLPAASSPAPYRSALGAPAPSVPLTIRFCSFLE